MFQVGDHEALKACVHASLGTLALVCAGYNAIAWILRRQPHLAANTALYVALTAFEVNQVARHYERT